MVEEQVSKIQQAIQMECKIMFLFLDLFDNFGSPTLSKGSYIIGPVSVSVS